MESIQTLLSHLDEEIQDPDEETFLLYSGTVPLQGLGFIDSRASVLEVQVGGRDVTVWQSPGVLASRREGGTTGAVLWKISPLFATWLSSPSNILFRTLLPKSSSTMIELGCGISPLNALALAAASRIQRYVLTDQPYVQKLVLQNLSENQHLFSSSTPSSSSSKHRTKKQTSKPSSSSPSPPSLIHFQPLDWESSQVTPSLTSSPLTSSFDALIACDCVFNYALLQPFVQTCADICRLRLTENINSSSSSSSSGDNHDTAKPPCLCIIAQQLRNDDVFNSWLIAFKEHFRVWRIPGDTLPEQLRPEAGFVIHVGILRDSFP